MSGSRPYRVLVGAMVVFVGFSAYMIAPASVSPLLVDRFDVDKAAVGAAISAAYVGWLLFQLPSGFLMDRYDNSDLLSFAVVVFLLATTFGAFAGSFLGFLLSRFFAGTAAGILWGVGANVVGETFRENRSDFLTGVFVASGPLGLAVGQFASPLLAAGIGLPGTFPAYAVLSVFGYVVFRSADPVTVLQTRPVRVSQFGRSLVNRPVLLLALSALCGNGAWLFINSWMPTYGTEVISLPLPTVGALMALAPLAGALARSSGGLSAERVGRRETIAGSLLLVVPVVVVFPVALSPVGFSLALLVSGFALQFGVGVYYVSVQDLMSEDLSGTGISVVTAFQLFGGMVAPIAGGWLIEAASWDVAFAAVAATALVGAFVVLLVPSTKRSTPTGG